MANIFSRQELMWNIYLIMLPFLFLLFLIKRQLYVTVPLCECKIELNVIFFIIQMFNCFKFFGEKTIIFPFNCLYTFVKDQWAIFILYYWSMSVPNPQSWLLQHRLNLKILLCESSNFSFFAVIFTILLLYFFI
jgi:hypothetical protein